MTRGLLRGLTATFVLLTIGTSALAEPAGSSFDFGIKAGLNVASMQDLENIDTIDKLDKESKTGFVGGAFLRFPLGSFQLQLEGLYSVKGAKGMARTLADSWKWEGKFTYLEFPLYLRYQLPTPLLKPFFFVGGSVAFLLEAEAYDEREWENWLKVKDSMETVDYGLVIGAGIEIIGITVEARYTHGLNKVSDDEAMVEFLSSAKNRTWSVMAGLELF